jgi:hypothetical protein
MRSWRRALPRYKVRIRVFEGLGIGGGCTVPLTAIGAGTGGSVTITLAPPDG